MSKEGEKMKKQRVLATLAVLGLVFGLGLSGCGGDDGDGGNGGNGGNNGGGYEPPKEGLVTFTNVPTGYVISQVQVSSTPVVSWVEGYNKNVSQPADNVWKPTVIGEGRKKEFNTATIQGASYKSENGVWTYQSSQIDFNFTGTGSVYANFNIAQGISGPNSFGINNVAFSDGQAVIDFATVLASANPELSNDIDENLIGTWNEKNTGASIFTITVSSSDGITWGGSSGSAIQTATENIKSQGYKVAWIAKDNKITYVYYEGGTKRSVDAYAYEINASGELELKVSGMTFMTLVKQP